MRVAAGTRARVKLCFHLIFSSIRGNVLLALELLGVALYFVSLGPSHQRRYGYYAPTSCGLHGHYRFANIIIASAYKELIITVYILTRY